MEREPQWKVSLPFEYKMAAMDIRIGVKAKTVGEVVRKAVEKYFKELNVDLEKYKSKPNELTQTENRTHD